jgi:signal transduction histidine kinase
VAQPLASSVRAGLESKIRKALALILSLSLPELIANALSQASMLSSVSWLVLLSIALVTITASVSSWLLAGRNIWFVLHGLTAGASLLLWPFMVSESAPFQTDLKPWIWWIIGLGIVSFGLYVNLWLGAIFSVAVCSGWFLLTQSEVGGSATLQAATQDSVYLFLFAGAVVGMISLVRLGADRADAANSEAIESAILQARVDAVERERQRLDALIHDRVLSTLLLAGKAQSPKEQENAAKLASNAILSLQEALVEPRSAPSVTPLGLFRALRKAALQLLPTIHVTTLGAGSEQIPAEKAQAITQATLQAIDNAGRHARSASVELVMDSPKLGELEVLVRDSGVGFRLDKLPRDRIGLKTSVIARMEAIGGSAKIRTSPGEGTEIRLRWPA